MKIILASNSPRRKEILSSVCQNLEIIPSKAEEISDPSLLPCELAEQNAIVKGEEVYERIKERESDDTYVISADTVVECYGEIFEKPKDRADAEYMISSLSGTAHSVHTGYCIIRLSDGMKVSGFDSTYVTFTELDADDVAYIIDNDNPYDKAGAYAIQGAAAPFICGITGCYNNVVGFPLQAVRAAMLENFGVKIEN
ncbi:MAG: septum formation protein Maf [Ruminococcaceae bacterium]|nr:septum formation protein Maf [Oscillospiraceae bacterium]